MLVGLFIGFSFLALIFLVVWSAICEGSKRKHVAFLILMFLVAMWALLLSFGTSHSIGLVAASLGLAVSVTALFVPFYIKKKRINGSLPFN